MAAVSSATVTLADIQSAGARIANEIIRTPLVLSAAASDRAGRPVYLKLENLQRTGAFKVRGALNKLTQLPAEERRRGVVCASSGNHGLGIAYAASRFGMRCIVVLPDNANSHKLALLKKLGAEVICHARTSDLNLQRATEIARDEGCILVHPFADPAVIAGQGTVGLEALEDLPDVQDVYVPIGGGGLIAGVAVAIKEQRPEACIWGVQPEGAYSMGEALHRGGIFALEAVDTIADGLAARMTAETNLALVQRYVEDVIALSDAAIADATCFLADHCKLVVEPSGAACLAGVFAQSKRQGPAIAIVSGGNASFEQLERLRQRFSH